MAEPADINVDELRRRARRRLVGAVVLALGVAVVVPMLLETEQKPLGEDVSVKIPPVDTGKFVNRLNDGVAITDLGAQGEGAAATSAPPATPGANETAPRRTQKYDTQVPGTPAAPPAAEPAVAPGAVPKEAAPASRTDAASKVGANTEDAKASGESARASAGNAKAGNEGAKAGNEGAGAKASTDSAKAGNEGAKATAENGKAGNEAKKASSAESAKPAHASASAGKGASGVSPHDGFAVQLAAFADDRGANALAGRLKKAGYAAYTEPLKTSKGTLWRVRVGPYPSREAAVAARDKLKTEGESGIVAAIK
jgi:DedD protein